MLYCLIEEFFFSNDEFVREIASFVVVRRRGGCGDGMWEVRGLWGILLMAPFLGP